MPRHKHRAADAIGQEPRLLDLKTSETKVVVILGLALVIQDHNEYIALAKNQTAGQRTVPMRKCPYWAAEGGWGPLCQSRKDLYNLVCRDVHVMIQCGTNTTIVPWRDVWDASQPAITKLRRLA